MQEPRIGVILDVDLDVDEHSASDEGSAMAHSPLRESSSCAETCETEPLHTLAASSYRRYIGKQYSCKEGVVGQLSYNAAVCSLIRRKKLAS